MDIAVVYILISVIAGGVGQVLLKKGMSTLGPLTLTARTVSGVLLKLVTNLYVISGLAVYGFSTLLWLTALSRVDLSYAYPFVSLGYVIMLLASWRIFHENITLLRLVGCLTVITGVILISRS